MEIHLDPTSSTAAPDSWLISETFLSVQGEGKLSGVPSFFIRTSGCNLRCSWCDTPHASWNPEGRRRTFNDLLAQLAATPAGHVVLTGGEPLIAPRLADFTARLKPLTPTPSVGGGQDRQSSPVAARSYHLTIETAGTVPPPPGLRCDLMSISPKLSNSTPAVDDPRDPTGLWHARHEQRRLNIPAIRDLILAAADFQLKFVVASPADLPEIEQLVELIDARIRDAQPDRRPRPSDILLMPEGVTPPSTEIKRWIVQACTARGWRYCPRLHIDLFGHTRGT